ncbi:MAG: hypothetical protein JKY95_04110, partial [Planctomycetaceae bacterium]|nr:hypothetical protein [Planctomycetaceae bacterium]
MQLSLYVAIIGLMLMYLHTGFRPSKYLFSMMSLVASGSSTLDEIMVIIEVANFCGFACWRLVFPGVKDCPQMFHFLSIFSGFQAFADVLSQMRGLL